MLDPAWARESREPAVGCETGPGGEHREWELGGESESDVGARLAPIPSLEAEITV